MRMLIGLVLIGSFAAFAVVSAQTAAPNPRVLFKTSKGDIAIELDAAKAPVTVKNFLAYVDAQFYDGTIFHRVIKGFMIQGGGLTADLQEKATKSPIKNEAGNGLKNKRGTIAMARTGVIDSATSQFFINHADNDFLNHRDNSAEGFGYCVFGKVVQGMEVVDAIAAVRTGSAQGMADVPRETVTILSIRRVEAK
jgi:cyclophilin family peptidyl-prolyl cis-trans isomerase